MCARLVHVLVENSEPLPDEDDEGVECNGFRGAGASFPRFLLVQGNLCVQVLQGVVRS